MAAAITDKHETNMSASLMRSCGNQEVKGNSSTPRCPCLDTSDTSRHSLHNQKGFQNSESSAPTLETPVEEIKDLSD
jgi:hypothetical protein